MPSEIKNYFPFQYPACKGLFTLLDSSLIPPDYLANSLNVSVVDGAISPFKMYSAFANQLTGDNAKGRILTQTTVKTSLGVEIMLRVRDDDTNTILEWYNAVDNSWDILLGGLTKGKRMAFADFNTATQDGVFFCNGVENYSFWKKAIGTIASNTATVITLNEESAAAQGFSDAGGTVIINGTEYAYTGISGATITGLSDLPTFDKNEGVAEAVDDTTYSSVPKFDVLLVADGRIWGAKTTNVRLYWSKVGDGTDWTTGDTPDSPGFRDFIEGEGGITGLGAIQENIIVFKRNLVRAYKLDYPTSTTRISISKDLKRGDAVGAACPDGIITMGEKIIYVTPKGGVKTISLTGDKTEFYLEDVTEIIRPTLKDGVFTSAKAIYWGKENIVLISYKKDSGSAYNDRVIVIEFTDQGKALGIIDWLVGDWTVYNGDLYFGGSFEPNTFKAFDGYQKGSGSSPFTALATFRRERFGDFYLQKELAYLIIEGWILPSAKLKFQIDYDYLGTMAHLESSFDSATETQYVIEPAINTIGAFEIGAEPIGGNINDIDELNHFKIFFTLPIEHHPREVQLTVYSDEAGARWKILPPLFLLKDAEFAVHKKLKKSFN